MSTSVSFSCHRVGYFMKVAVYPGSFNPWHRGHLDVYTKALRVFDKVVIAFGINPDKKSDLFVESDMPPGAETLHYSGLLVDFINGYNSKNPFEEQFQAVIRGLRSGYDLQYEQNMQYWNEDLGLGIPTVYFITDRTLAHISSSALRSIRRSATGDL